MSKTKLCRKALWLFLTAGLVLTACSKSPEDIRAWMRDKRAPVKMKEFIENKRYPLASKVEAVMVLVERNNSTDIPAALSGISSAELNSIVTELIPRLKALLQSGLLHPAIKPWAEISLAHFERLAHDDSEEQRGRHGSKVKDAAYALLQLNLTPENREALLALIRNWLDSDNFFLPLERAGRVEQARLFAVLGNEALPIFENAIKRKLEELDKLLEEETKKEEEMRQSGKRYRVVHRPSDKLAETLMQTLKTLESLKIPGADDAIAKIFIERIEARYPDMPRGLALPFMNNPSALLLPLAERIVLDGNYQSPLLNYYKNVMMATYYRKVQKEAGVRLCNGIVQNDSTGYLRWDCLEILTLDAGKDRLIPIIGTLPNDPKLLSIPSDHPQFIAQPTMTLWNAMLVYCTHLSQNLNGPVPMDELKLLAQNGATAISRMLAIACIQSNGKELELEFLNNLSHDRMDIAAWGLQVRNIGELAAFNARALEHRLKAAKEAAKQKAESEAAAKAAADKPKPEREQAPAAPEKATPEAEATEPPKSSEENADPANSPQQAVNGSMTRRSRRRQTANHQAPSDKLNAWNVD